MEMSSGKAEYLPGGGYRWASWARSLRGGDGVAMGNRPMSRERKRQGEWLPRLTLASARLQSYKDIPGVIRMIRTSMTFVWVGPVISKSPRRSKNG